MAGAQLWGVSRDEAEEMLHKAIDDFFAPPKTNEDKSEG